MRRERVTEEILKQSEKETCRGMNRGEKLRKRKKKKKKKRIIMMFIKHRMNVSISRRPYIIHACVCERSI